MRCLIFVFVLALSSCTAIQDVGQYTEDFSCGVDIRLREFFPHAQRPGTPGDVSSLSQVRERFGVYVVRGIKEPSGEFRRDYVARAFFDPLPSTDVDIRLPFAIEAAQTGDELPATLELHADRQALRDEADPFEISTVPDDHSWVFPHACSEVGTEFGHVADFDQLEPATEGSFELKVRPASRTLPAAQFWVDTTFEVRVIRDTIIDGQEVEQARAFYRRGAATDNVLEQPEDGEHAEIDLGGVLREDEDVEVIVFADRNGNGVFDANADPLESDFAISVDVILGQEAGRVMNCRPDGHGVGVRGR